MAATRCAQVISTWTPVRTGGGLCDFSITAFVLVGLAHHAQQQEHPSSRCRSAEDSPDREGRPEREFAARAATPAPQGQVVMLLFLLSPFCTRLDLSSGCRPTVVAPRAWLVSVQRRTCWGVCVCSTLHKEHSGHAEGSVDEPPSFRQQPAPVPDDPSRKWAEQGESTKDKTSLVHELECETASQNLIPTGRSFGSPGFLMNVAGRRLATFVRKARFKNKHSVDFRAVFGQSSPR